MSNKKGINSVEEVIKNFNEIKELKKYNAIFLL